MRVQSIKFDGYASGQTAFSPELIALAPEETRTAYQELVTRLVTTVLNPGSGERTAVLVAGHADRDQDPGDCEEKRKRERDRARERAFLAWTSLRDTVTAALTVAMAGASPGEWWDTSPVLTWALVYAGSGQPVNEFPVNDAERAANRRVHFLVSKFP